MFDTFLSPNTAAGYLHLVKICHSFDPLLILFGFFILSIATFIQMVCILDKRHLYCY